MFLALCYKAVLYPSCYFLLVYSVEEWPQSLLISHVCSDCNRGGTAYCKLHTVTTRLILCQSQTLHPRDVFFQTRSCNLLKLIFITVLMKAPHLADVVYQLNRIFRPGPKTCFDRSNVQSSPTYQGALTIRSAYFLLCCFIFCGIVLCIWGWNPAGQQAPRASMLDSMTGGNGCQLKLYQVLEMKHDRRETDGKERSCEKRPAWRHGVTHTD